MEVASLITSSIEIVHLFDKFIYHFSDVDLVSKDEEMAYFKSNLDDKDRLYYHYILNDVDYEFSYNYKEEDILVIREYFKGKEIFIFDLSYSSEDILKSIFNAFKSYLSFRNPELIVNILVSHPFLGIEFFETMY